MTKRAGKSGRPQAAIVFQQSVKADRSKLGTLSEAEITQKGLSFVVVNAYTQYDFRGPGILADYDAIRSAFRTIKARFSGMRIGYPLIGAGLARGDWEIIAEIIDEELEGEDHTLVRFRLETA